MAVTVESQVVKQVRDKEKDITHKTDPDADGPTVAAQKHAAEKLDAKVISDITSGEKHITDGQRLKEGPTSIAQSILAKNRVNHQSRESTEAIDMPTSVTTHDDANTGIRKRDSVSTLLQTASKTLARLHNDVSELESLQKALEQKIALVNQKSSDQNPKLDGTTISTIFAAERELTGKSMPVKGGPTAQAQRHAGEDIDSGNIRAVSAGEKLITGNVEMTKGGPTAILQQRLSNTQPREGP